MRFDPDGYLLRSGDGTNVWFLDTRMSVKAGPEQTAPPDVPRMIEVSRRHGIETLGPPPG